MRSFAKTKPSRKFSMDSRRIYNKLTISLKNAFHTAVFAQVGQAFVFGCDARTYSHGAVKQCSRAKFVQFVATYTNIGS